MAYLVPRPSDCPACRGGRVGLDLCEPCGGTGRVFQVKGQTFPDTRKGFDAAYELLNGFAPDR